MQTPGLSEWSLGRQRSPDYRDSARKSLGNQGIYWSGIESDEAKISSTDGWRAGSPQLCIAGQSGNSWSRDMHEAFDLQSPDPMAIKRYPRKTTHLSKFLEHLTFKQPNNLR